jgi:hypothetical protein
MVAPLAPVGPAAVAREVAEAANRPGRMPPRLPLRKRSLRAVRLPPQRMLSIGDPPALPILDRLLHRPIPGTATLDRGRPLAQLTRPLRPQHLGRAGVGALAPRLHAPQLAPLVCQVGGWPPGGPGTAAAGGGRCVRGRRHGQRPAGRPGRPPRPAWPAHARGQGRPDVATGPDHAPGGRPGRGPAGERLVASASRCAGRQTATRASLRPGASRTQMATSSENWPSRRGGWRR